MCHESFGLSDPVNGGVRLEFNRGGTHGQDFMRGRLGCAWLGLALLAPVAAAQDSFTFTFENDVFTGGDGHYTAGLGLTWAEGDIDSLHHPRMPGWLGALGRQFGLAEEGDSYIVSQQIQYAMSTPVDISQSAPIEGDLPYVGYLGWRGTIHRTVDRVDDQMSLVIGLVGPVVAAEDVQSAIHELTNSEDPQGWDNQIDNEAVVRIGWRRAWRLYVSSNKGLEGDVIGIADLGAGNLESSVGTGVVIRVGTDLAASFPTVSYLQGREGNPLIGTSRDDWFLYLGVDARWTFNTIFVNGNTFGDDNSSVTLDHPGGALVAGWHWSLDGWSLDFTYARQTRQFRETSGTDAFGSMALTWRW